MKVKQSKKKIPIKSRFVTEGFVHEEVDSLARMSAVQFSSIDNRFNGIDKRLDKVECRLDDVEQGLGNLSLELMSFKKEVHIQFSHLREDVKCIKDMQEKGQMEIRALIVFMKGHESRISNLEDKVTVLERV